MVEQIHRGQIGEKMKSREELEKIAKNMRKDVFIMGVNSGPKGAHIGGAMSAIEILTVLYADVMKYDAEHPENDNRDRFIMSKAHSAIALYAALKYAGFLSEKDIEGALQGDSWLYKHPRFDVKHGFEFAGGSLGQGLGQGAGSALALRLRGNRESKVYVLLGDGECDEGAVWEAAAFIQQYQLVNVVTIIDRNRLQNDGTTDQVLTLGDLGKRFEAMGFDVSDVDGHNVIAVRDALKKVSAKPKVIIANTIKGKGVSFAENNVDWHISYFTQEMYHQAVEELG